MTTTSAWRYHRDVTTPLRIGRAATGAALAAMGMAALHAQAPTQPAFRAGTDLVVVPVVVVDGKGNDITTLTRNDFIVAEDGRPVAVETFVAPGASDTETGRYVVVVVDNVNIPAEGFWRARSIATKVADRLGPGDRLAVIALAGGRASDGSSKAQVKTDIARISPSAGGEVQEPGRNANDGLEALIALAGQVAASPHRRKVLVLVGSPAIFSPSEPSAFSDRDPDLSPLWLRATQQLGEANVALHVIDPSGLRGAADDYSTSFATATGGLAWATNAYDRTIDRIWRDAGTYYLLGYRAPIDDHRAHAISVRVNLPGTTVRARRIRG